MKQPADLLSRVQVALLHSGHDGAAFRCGVQALEHYLGQQAGQDSRRHVASVFVAQDCADNTVVGFYTLSTAAVPLGVLPAQLMRKLPNYPTIPAVRLGRLAVDLRAKGAGLGAHLLLDALARALSSEMAWALFVVDAKDANAAAFYAKFGFAALADDPNRLFLPRATIAGLFGPK